MNYWLLLSRTPFFSVLVLPYMLGSVWAGSSGQIISWPVFWLGLAGAVAMQLAAHYSGEVHDLAEDRLSLVMEKNFFSGGSTVLVKNQLSPEKVIRVNRVVIGLALALGLLLQFYFKTGNWTIWLGTSGLLCAYFYSTPPLRLVSRGVGELLIAYAFGWLSVNSGFYLQAGRFELLGIWMSLPIACSVANIILINEFPDYPADKQCLKNNLLVRVGKENGAKIYSALVLSGGAGYLLALGNGLPARSAIFYLPVLILSLFLAHQMLKGAYQDKKKLQVMCGLTILVNLGTTLSCILGWLK